MTIAEAGGTVYFEPDSLVTYVPGPPLELTDMHFYMLRWSNAWTMASLDRLREKWDLATDGYFKHKYKKLGWRRRKTIIRPLSCRLSMGLNLKPVNKVLNAMDKILNRYLTDRYAWSEIQRQKNQVATRQQKSSTVELSRS
jgi:hypothetical protein